MACHHKWGSPVRRQRPQCRAEACDAKSATNASDQRPTVAITIACSHHDAATMLCHHIDEQGGRCAPMFLSAGPNAPVSCRSARCCISTYDPSTAACCHHDDNLGVLAAPPTSVSAGQQPNVAQKHATLNRCMHDTTVMTARCHDDTMMQCNHHDEQGGLLCPLPRQQGRTPQCHAEARDIGTAHACNRWHSARDDARRPSGAPALHTSAQCRNSGHVPL